MDEKITEENKAFNDIVETYEFFANPISANLSHHKGIKLIIEKLYELDIKITKIQEILSANIKPIEEKGEEQKIVQR